MADLRVGYDVFAGSSQAGQDSSVPGVLQAETSVKGLHKVQVQRLSDDEYFNATTLAFQAGVPAEADDLDFQGSESDRGIQPAIARLSMRLPKEVNANVDSSGMTITVYGTGLTPAGGVAITLAYQPTTTLP